MTDDTSNPSFETVLRELGRIAFADLSDVARWGPDGIELKPAAYDADSVAEITDETDEHGNRTISVSLPGKLDALDLLRRLMDAPVGDDLEAAFNESKRFLQTRRAG